MKKAKLLPVSLIIITATIVGMMNTVLLNPEDIGTWKNYLGIFFLIIAAVNFILIFVLFSNHREKNKPYVILLKIFAVLLPFYFVFYDSIYANQENPKMKELLGYLAAGFILYFVIGVIIYYTIF